jgi:aminopeptidase
MPGHADSTRRLAELVVGFGANVQPGQIVGVTAFTGMEEMNREVARAAYRAGARWVDVVTFDSRVKRSRVDHAPQDSLEYVPPWMVNRLEWLSAERAARISLNGPSEPDALEGADAARAGRDLLPYLPNSSAVVNALTTNWCVAPAPTRGWAERVYPDLEPGEAYDRLWEAIAHVCRLDAADPAEAWRRRGAELQTAAQRLTERRFDAIRLHGPGTDLTVGLFRSSAWHAGDSETAAGLRHFSNLPTEETFTTPDPARADGVVTATRPLVLHGALIDGIRVEFSGGRVTRIDASSGADALRAAAARDDGAGRLGELALVDASGRIGPLGTVFWETLLDENAASHIALGSAYRTPVEDAAERERANASEIHVDFMIGGPEVDVDGITEAGETVPVLREGDWCLP